MGVAAQSRREKHPRTSNPANAGGFPCNATFRAAPSATRCWLDWGFTDPMSNLYVRLHSSFWTHRKTLQLRRKLGDAAFWIPPRLWTFAAENAPNGDLSNYLAEDLAMLVQYSGDARVMLEALHEAGFLENGIIRNWRSAIRSTSPITNAQKQQPRLAGQNETKPPLKEKKTRIRTGKRKRKRRKH